MCPDGPLAGPHGHQVSPVHLTGKLKKIHYKYFHNTVYNSIILHPINYPPLSQEGLFIYCELTLARAVIYTTSCFTRLRPGWWIATVVTQ